MWGGVITPLEIAPRWEVGEMAEKTTTTARDDKTPTVTHILPLQSSLHRQPTFLASALVPTLALATC